MRTEVKEEGELEWHGRRLICSGFKMGGRMVLGKPEPARVEGKIEFFWLPLVCILRNLLALEKCAALCRLNAER